MIQSLSIILVSIAKYNQLARSSYINLSKELENPQKELANIQNIDDNECFLWYLVRYLNPVDYQSARIAKADKDFANRLDFKDIKFPVKVRKLEIYTKLKKKKNSIGISVSGFENKKNIQFIYQKNAAKKTMFIYF